MCEACNAPFWLTPRRAAEAELAAQQARLASRDRECPRCAELEAEVDELRRELRLIEEYYEREP